MLSYRHAFHAGSFADVLKHAVLVHALRHAVASPSRSISWTPMPVPAATT